MNTDAPLRFFHPVLPVRALDAGPQRITLAGAHYVVFRGEEGRVGVLADRCPHRFAPLSRGHVAGGRLHCPYHGWNFDVQGIGRSPSQPSLRKCDAQAMQAFVRQDYVWMAGPDVSVATAPEGFWPGWDYAGAFTVPFEAPLYVVLDNFSEDEHTPFVHTRLGWDRSDCDKIEFEAENFDDRTEVVYRAPQRESVLLRPFGLRRGDIFHNAWTTYFDPVRTIYTLHWTDASGEVRRPIGTKASIYMVPITEKLTHMTVFVHVKADHVALRVGAPVLMKLGVEMVRREILDDAEFVKMLADTPPDMKGMRLGRFDKPLIHNRKLLKSVYWGSG